MIEVTRRRVVMFNNVDQHLINLQEQYELGDRDKFPRVCIAELDDIDYKIIRPYINKLQDNVGRITNRKATAVTIHDRVLAKDEGFDGNSSERWVDVNKVYLVWTGVLPPV